MRVASPSDQALIQAQYRLELPGGRLPAGPATPAGDDPGVSRVPEVRVYEGEYVPGDAGRATTNPTYTFNRQGIFDGAAGYGQSETGAHHGTPAGVLRYLEQQTADAEVLPVGRGRLGQHLDIFV